MKESEWIIGCYTQRNGAVSHSITNRIVRTSSSTFTLISDDRLRSSFHSECMYVCTTRKRKVSSRVSTHAFIKPNSTTPIERSSITIIHEPSEKKSRLQCSLACRKCSVKSRSKLRHIICVINLGKLMLSRYTRKKGDAAFSLSLFVTNPFPRIVERPLA